MMSLFVKTLGIWLVMVMAAIVNAAIREKAIAPAIGPKAALPVSGLTLSLFIFLIVYAAIPLFGSLQPKTCFQIGLVWVALTLCFEFLFGHFGAGKSWREILQVFNVARGDLFMVALITTLISPWIAAKLRGLV